MSRNRPKALTGFSNGGVPGLARHDCVACGEREALHKWDVCSCGHRFTGAPVTRPSIGYNNQSAAQNARRLKRRATLAVRP